MSTEKAISVLSQLLGASKVRSDDYVRAAYSCEGMAAFPPGMPDAVVYPASTEEIQTVVRVANEHRVPLIPMGGRLAAFRMLEVERGGILVDLCEMNRVIELDEQNQSITVQAGMTDYMVDRAMRARGYRLMVHPVGQAAAICAGSEVAKNSLGIYGAMSGPQDRWVLGLKVVLGSGEVLQTGASRVFGAGHFSRHHLPDLTGLFMASEGALGIITEVTFRMAKLHRSLRFADFHFPRNEEGLRNLSLAAQEVRSKELVSQGMFWSPPSCQSWYERNLQHYGTPEGFDPRSLGEYVYDRYGHMFSVVIESLYSDEEAELKEKEVRRICEARGGQYLGPVFSELLPIEDGGYGEDGREIHPYQIGEFGRTKLNWHYVWLQGPYEAVTEFDRLCPPTFERAGLAQPLCYHAAYFTPYAAVLTAYVHYDASDPGEIEKVRRWYEMILEECYGKIGAVPVNTGRAVRGYALERADPPYLETMRKIKKLFDPNGIMNPGVGIF